MRLSNEQNTAFGEVTSFPGCAVLAVSHAVYVKSSHRRVGVGDAAHADRRNQMRQLGYVYVLCTVNKENEAQIAILLNNGWRLLTDFWNPQTDHLCQVWGCDLADHTPLKRRVTCQHDSSCSEKR